MDSNLCVHCHAFIDPYEETCVYCGCEQPQKDYKMPVTSLNPAKNRVKSGHGLDADAKAIAKLKTQLEIAGFKEISTDRWAFKTNKREIVVTLRWEGLVQLVRFTYNDKTKWLNLMPSEIGYAAAMIKAKVAGLEKARAERALLNASNTP